jgi:MFS family permease
MYASNGAYASFVYLSGPVSPVLTEDLGMPVASAGLIGTALALGISTASAVAPRAVRAVGRDRAIRGGLLVLAAALVGTLIVPHLSAGTVAFAAILALVWIGATGGGTVINASTARLSDLHPAHSARVITEANAAAAWVGLFSPLLLGAALGAGLGWSAGIVACLAAIAVALVILVVAGRMTRSAGAAADEHTLHHPVEPALEVIEEPPPTQAAPGGPARLPRVFWVAMVALFAAVATEFAITFWGSTLIQDQTGASASAATSAMSAVVAGIAIGRTAGSALTARLGRHRMLLGGFVLALVGFGILWSAGTLGLAIVGLAIAGLGLATLFPLVLDRGIVLSDGHPDLAMSRSSLVLGLAAGSAPFALGALGSVMPVRTAMLLVPVVALLGLVGVVMSRPSTTGAQAT